MFSNLFLSCCQDMTCWVYFLTVLFSLINTTMFIWWWVKAKKVSLMFMVNTIIFLGIGINFIFEFYARCLYFITREGCCQLILHDIWSMRLTVVLIVVMTTTVIIFKRIRSFNNKYGRRDSD